MIDQHLTALHGKAVIDDNYRLRIANEDRADQKVCLLMNHLLEQRNLNKYDDFLNACDLINKSLSDRIREEIVKEKSKVGL